MINRIQLLADLQVLLRRLEADLLERSEEIAPVKEALRGEHQRARTAERTAQSYEDWRSDYITQIAAAWVLSVVFARFLEDNLLVDPPKIAGPGERLTRARDEHELYFRAHPTETDREYLLHIFNELARLPGTQDIFGAHNPIHELPTWLSGDAAGALLTCFQRIDANTGVLVHDFTDPDWNTRFLGDLYQALSEAARKKYALLQTPEFVEEFIFDRTLEPAIEEFGLEGFRMVDPTCGSGHFLLGAFQRILDRWLRTAPGTGKRELVQRALDAVYGVDVNPYAVAIARFRLLVAALQASNIIRLREAPGFRINVTAGDSLLHGRRFGELHLKGETVDLRRVGGSEHVYCAEDLAELNRILGQQYHVVVGNPPYITIKDAALNQAYRNRYSTCHRQYSLGVPFTQRFFDLAINDHSVQSVGYVGMITANSFMKREFGKKLIEEFFPQIDLTQVIDTSGAYIPGHGTPTVILFGRHREPVCHEVRAVLGIRGEPSTPDEPSQGQVWRSIVEHLDRVGSQNEYVSVMDMPRPAFARHPWSIGGGGVIELKNQIENISQYRLESYITGIGRTTHTGEDEVFYLPVSATKTLGLLQYAVPLIIGERVRDWQLDYELMALFPYHQQTGEPREIKDRNWEHYCWLFRTNLKNRKDFGNYIEDRGLRWFDHSMFFPARFRTPLSITYAEVATHNHFVFDRSRKVCKQTAPIIKLPNATTEDSHFALLGLLNSSTACFWMKQVFYPKSTATGDISTEKGRPEANRYAFASTGLAMFPLPVSLDTVHLRFVEAIARRIDTAARELEAVLPHLILQRWGRELHGNLKELLVVGEQSYSRIHGRMVVLQEELDWEVYRLFRLSEEGASAVVLKTDDLSIDAEQRPFDWKTGSPPENLPSKLRDLYERRYRQMTDNCALSIIEDPVFKRPWWGRQGVYGRLSRDYRGWTEDALQSWLLNRLESYFDFDGRMNDAGTLTAKLDIALISTAWLADAARQDTAFMQVGELYRNDPAFDVHLLVAELVEAESVPLLPALRYKDSGRRKRRAWEQTWDLQRQEDVIDARTGLSQDHPQYLADLQAQALKRHQIGDIPVPPKYTSGDFINSTYWRLRGKLDVPKERWVSFPHCEGPDGTLMIAWAGYDHLQLARAISAYYVDIQERLGGRDDQRLVPLLACMIELLPWLKQWHNDVDPEFGMHMGDYFEGFIQEEARQMGKTLDQIKAWEPPKKTTRRRSKAVT